MKTTETDQDLDNVIQHLASKVVARAQVGETTIKLRVSPGRHRRYNGKLQTCLWRELEISGIRCFVRQWTGVGHCGVLEVVID